MQAYKDLILLFAGGLLVWLSINNALAQPVFVPSIATADKQQQVIYYLDKMDVRFAGQVFYKYRISKIDLQTKERQLISRLGSQYFPVRQDIVDMAWDGESQRLILVDAYTKEISALRPYDRRRTIVSNTKVGVGAPFGALGSLVVDPIAQRLIVVDQAKSHNASNQRVLTQVSLVTGERTPFYTTQIQDSHSVYDLSIDPSTYQLFLLYGPGLITFDLSGAQQFTLSDGFKNIGDGALMIRGERVAHDYNRHQLLVSEPLQKQFIAVDIATGTRRGLLDPAEEGGNLCWPQAVSVVGDFAWIADAGHRAWFLLDLSNNRWHDFSDPRDTSSSPCAGSMNAKLTSVLSKRVPEMRQLIGPAHNGPVLAMEADGPVAQIQAFFNRFLQNLSSVLNFIAGVISLPVLVFIFYPLIMAWLSVPTAPDLAGTNPAALAAAILLLFALPSAVLLALITGGVSYLLSAALTLVLSPLVFILSLFV